MSTQLVRKLLRATEDVDSDAAAAAAAAAAVELSSSKKRKRKEQKDDGHHQPCTEEQVMDWHVQNLLTLDRSMAKTTSRGKSKSNSEIVAKQWDIKQGKERQCRRNNVDEILTNSRSAAIQKSKFTKHVPTFNKDKYQKDQKEKSLRQIVKLLKKEEKKNEKKKKKERA